MCRPCGDGECLDKLVPRRCSVELPPNPGYAIKICPSLASPARSNEKGICAALAFRLLGMNSYHSVYAPTQGSERVTEFMEHGTKPLLGSEMVVDVDHRALAKRIVEDMDARRRTLGWKVNG